MDDHRLHRAPAGHADRGVARVAEEIGNGKLSSRVQFPRPVSGDRGVRSRFAAVVSAIAMLVIGACGPS
jgi:hypothetical protein